MWSGNKTQELERITGIWRTWVKIRHLLFTNSGKKRQSYNNDKKQQRVKTVSLCSAVCRSLQKSGLKCKCQHIDIHRSETAEQAGSAESRGDLFNPNDITLYITVLALCVWSFFTDQSINNRAFLANSKTRCQLIHTSAWARLHNSLML